LSRPAWLPAHIPELDGLRGLAIIPVVIYHCHGKFYYHWIEQIAQWGWAGVNLFFILSGFLITGIIVDGRSDKRFFVNFYGRRSLRIWPVYVLLIVANYFIVPIAYKIILMHSWAQAGEVWHDIATAPWLLFALFIQNLFTLALPGAMTPTWSLCVEEQFYLAWAPVARFLREGWLMTIALVVLIGCPLFRAHHPAWVSPTNTLVHLDGLAVGALVALGIRRFAFDKNLWRWIGRAMILVGGGIAIYLLFGGSPWSDMWLAVGFGGMLLAAISSSGLGTLYTRALSLKPLRFYGKISYGLYMTHILSFIIIGALDEALSPRGAWGAMTVIAFRFAVSTLIAVIMWEKFEKKILQYKSRFEARVA